MSTSRRFHDMLSILAIEPDPDRANALTQLVHDCIDAKVVVSASADVAVSVMARRMPELILMSAFTPPHDEQSVMAYLRRTPNVNVPVLVVWPIFERRPEKAQILSGLYRTRRGGATEIASMREALAARMRGALEISRERATGGIRGDFIELTGQPHSPQHAVCVPRAHRWTPHDVAWLSGVRLPSGDVRQPVNISNSGLLIESDSALMPGSSVTFQLCANGTELWRPNTNLIVPARIVRSEVSRVAADQLRYLVAAQFRQALVLPSNDATHHEASSRTRDVDVHLTVRDEADDMARLAADRLQNLARVLENLESAVVRIGAPTDPKPSRPRIH